MSYKCVKIKILFQNNGIKKSGDYSANDYDISGIA